MQKTKVAITLSTLTKAISPELAITFHKVEDHRIVVARAKLAAANLGLHVHTRTEKIVASNTSKYDKPHQGKREMERRAKRQKLA